MKKFLIVVDMQNDFVDGALGTKEAQAIVDKVVDKIENFDGEIIVTLDTHYDHYLHTIEGKKLPVVHCIRETEGWQLNKKVAAAVDKKGYTVYEKFTFGAKGLPQTIINKVQGDDFTIELIGLCTDICVVSNALLLKAHFYDREIYVDSSCCAGVTPQSHQEALNIIKMCHINVI